METYLEMLAGEISAKGSKIPQSGIVKCKYRVVGKFTKEINVNQVD